MTSTHLQGVDLKNIMASTWKCFALADKRYLLHVPSMHLLDVDQATFDHVDGNTENPAAAQNLAEFLKTLPPPKKRQPQSTRITSIALNVAEQCNLRCTYCYAGDGNYGEDSMMATTIAKASVDFFLQQSDRLHIIFFGGEPLMNFSLIKAVVAHCETFSDKSFSYSMTTNAVLLTRQQLEYFTEKKFSLTISYDGKGIHGRQRLNLDKKTNSEAIVLKKLSTLKTQLEKLRRFQVRGTILPENVDLATEAVAAAVSELPHAMMLSLAADESPFASAKADLDTMLTATRATVKQLLDQKNLEPLRRMTAIWQFVVLLHRGETTSMTCHAGLNYVSVSTTGHIYICHRFTEDSRALLGNIKDGIDQDKIKAIQDHRLTEHQPCNQCWMRGVCAGGCFHENMLAGKTAFQPDPKFCYLQNGLMELALEVYVQLRQEHPAFLETKKVNWRTEDS